MYLPSHSLDCVSPTDLLLCFEVLSPDLAKERVVELQVQQVGAWIERGRKVQLEWTCRGGGEGKLFFEHRQAFWVVHPAASSVPWEQQESGSGPSALLALA